MSLSKKLYEQEFERPFIAETQNYYRLESNHYITGSSCFAYLQRAKQRLNEELDRLLNYLDPSTERLLISTFMKEYIENRREALTPEEFKTCLAHLVVTALTTSRSATEYVRAEIDKASDKKS